MRIAVTTPTGTSAGTSSAMLLRAGVRPLLLPGTRTGWTRRCGPRSTPWRSTSSTPTRSSRRPRAWTRCSGSTRPPAARTRSADYARATDAVVAAVAENGIARVVFQSSIGAEKRHGAGEIDGLARTEEALDATGADVTHLRCGFFFSNLLLQTGRDPGRRRPGDPAAGPAAGLGRAARHRRGRRGPAADAGGPAATSRRCTARPT